MWRMYEYVDDAERQQILTSREEKREFILGQGGEGYIAPEDWCYNCGECGHLGDVRASISFLSSSKVPVSLTRQWVMIGLSPTASARPPTRALRVQ